MNAVTYLGVRLTVVERAEDGYWWCLWPDGKRWKHWHSQLVPADA